MPAFPKSLRSQFLAVFSAVLALAAGLVGVSIWELDQANRRMREITSRQVTVLRATTRLSALTEAVSTGAANLLMASDEAALGKESEGLQKSLTEIELLQPKLLEDETNDAILDLQERSQAYRVIVNVVLQLRQEGFRDERAFRELLLRWKERSRDVGGIVGFDLLRLIAAADPTEIEQMKAQSANASEEAQTLIAVRQRQLTRSSTLRKYAKEMEDLGHEMASVAKESELAAGRAYDQSIAAHLHASKIGGWKLTALFLASSLGAFILIRYLVQRRILERIDVVSAWLRGKAPATRELAIPVRGRDEIADMARSVEAFMEDRRKLVEAQRETEAAREEAVRANLMKSKFLANISHEIRTPMNAILGYAQLMATDGGLSRQQQERVGTINRAGEHLLALINDILEMSKIESGSITRNDSAFDLHGILDDLMVVYSGRANDKGLAFELKKSPSLPRLIRCDESKVRQTLVNLLGNAVKFTKDGGVKIEATATQKGGAFVLSFTVTDTGPGIANDEIGKLFRPFAQLAAGASMGGTGLGLAISRQYARLLGGDITVASEFGKGSSFTFTFEAYPAKSAEVVRKPETLMPRRLVDGQSARILVVDDVPTNNQLLEDVLRPMGFDTRSASNGKEALEIFHEWLPDAILMDMRMPVMDGYEANRRIRASGKPVFIVALTASAFEEDKIAVIESGADTFMRKPFKQEELLVLLGEQLHLRYEYDEPRAIPGGDGSGPANFAALSEVFQTGLQKACGEADYERLLELCDDIAAEGHTREAERARERVLAFDYDGLARLLMVQSAAGGMPVN